MRVKGRRSALCTPKFISAAGTWHNDERGKNPPSDRYFTQRQERLEHKIATAGI